MTAINMPDYWDDEDEYGKFGNSTCIISSKIGYLIGIQKSKFGSDQSSMMLDIYNKMDQDKNARIIRHLCIIRTAIERNFKKINEAMKFQYKSVLSLPEYIPTDSMLQLSNDGISFVKKSSTLLCHHIIEINRLISDRINNCRSYFPDWIEWSYIRDLFIMKNGLTEQGTKEAATVYFENMANYPFKMYINWTPQDCGNILYNDKKFLTILYDQHSDYFTDYDAVSDASAAVKNNIYEFIETAGRVVMIVDCENSDPYRLCAAILGLDSETTSKIQKIILLDDVNTVNAWKCLDNQVQIAVEHIMTERILENKSLVDIELTARTCMEHYRNLVDSFVLVSSDSDYWGLISSLPEARFLVMMEREKCSDDLKAAMGNRGIFYCYIEDFHTGNSDKIKQNALFDEMHLELKENFKLNFNELLDKAMISARITMAPHERQQFFDRHLRQARILVNRDGDVTFEFKKK